MVNQEYQRFIGVRREIVQPLSILEERLHHKCLEEFWIPHWRYGKQTEAMEEIPMEIS